MKLKIIHAQISRLIRSRRPVDRAICDLFASRLDDYEFFKRNGAIMDLYFQPGVRDQLRNRTKYSCPSSRTRRSRDEKTNERTNDRSLLCRSI